MRTPFRPKRKVSLQRPTSVFLKVGIQFKKITTDILFIQVNKGVR